MSDAFQSINHCLFKGILVFFVMPRALRREQFEKCVGLLEKKAKVKLSKDGVVAYWRAIEERMAGTARWDRFSPMIDRDQDFVGHFRSQNDIDNIHLKKPYPVFSISGIKYLMDVFNPHNELGIQYPGAGQPVLALVMKEESYGNIFDRLAENADFYEIVRELASVCEAETIVGMNSGDLATLMRAYYENRIDRSTDPWSFLFPLNVLKLPKPVGDIALKRYFKRIEDWGDGRLLLQVKPGIDFTLNRQNADAAKVLGMVPVQELNPEVAK
jgi:hypothetical protein